MPDALMQFAIAGVLSFAATWVVVSAVLAALWRE